MKPCTEPSAYRVTLHSTYGYVGPVKRSSTRIKVNGQTVARVAQSQRGSGYFAEFSFNAGRTYSWSWSASPDKAELIAKVSKESIRIYKDLEKKAKELSKEGHGTKRKEA